MENRNGNLDGKNNCKALRYSFLKLCELVATYYSDSFCHMYRALSCAYIIVELMEIINFELFTLNALPIIISNTSINDVINDDQ